jgi:hypothetical protein
VYSVAVSRAGYKRWTGQITLHDRESQTVSVALEPAMAIVRLSSQPTGLAAELDGKRLDGVTPIEFVTAPGPHHLTVVGATATWPQDFVAAADGTYTFHAVLAPAKRTATTAASSGVARTTPGSDRSPQRATSGGGARASAGREPVVELEDRVVELAPESLPAKLPLRAEPRPVPVPQLDPAVTRPMPSTGPVPRSSTPPLVPASTVTKLSGEIPALQGGSGSADVYSKICIGIDGRVTSVKVVRPSVGIAAALQRTLLGWRYKPYVDDAGQPSPACFALSFRLVFERAL